MLLSKDSAPFFTRSKITKEFLSLIHPRDHPGINRQTTLRSGVIIAPPIVKKIIIKADWFGTRWVGKLNETDLHPRTAPTLDILPCYDSPCPKNLRKFLSTRRDI